MKKYILLLISVSCFGQFNPVQWYEFGNVNTEVNTFIGGIAGTINTRELLATKLGINVGRIKRFEVIGSDVQCAVINGNYGGGNWGNDANITHFYDNRGLVKDMVYRGVRDCPELDSVYYPKLETIIDECFFGTKLEVVEFPELLYATGNYACFRSNTFLKKFIAPKAIEIYHTNDDFLGSAIALELVDVRSLIKLGSTHGRDGYIFNNSNLANLTIYANSVLQTSNAGGVEGDLAFAIAGGATVVWVTP